MTLRLLASLEAAAALCIASFAKRGPETSFWSEGGDT